MFQEKGGIFSGIFKKTPKLAEAARPEEVKVSFLQYRPVFFSVIFLLQTFKGNLEVFSDNG